MYMQVTQKIEKITQKIIYNREIGVSFLVTQEKKKKPCVSAITMILKTKVCW